MNLRDHAPIVIDTFNGLWKRGKVEDTPLDHFQDCNNIRFSAGGDVVTRDGIEPAQDVPIPLAGIKRIYNYPTQTANTLLALAYTESFFTNDLTSVPINIFIDLEDYEYEDRDIFLDSTIHLQETVLIEDEDNNLLIPYAFLSYFYVKNFHSAVGRIYHIVSSVQTFGPILSIDNMTDFAFVPYAGRAYISPFTSFGVGGLTQEKGMPDEFVYVYKGDGVSARKAAGDPLSGTMTIANGSAGNTDPGLHIFGIVGETDTGYLTPPGVLGTFTTLSTNSVSFGNIPPVQNGVKRHLVASKVISGYSGNLQGYPLFFVPDAVINNNTSTSLNNISFFDSSLLEDASHLFNNYPSIPASAVLTLYHNRLCAFNQFDNISLGLISHQGEPEAINQINGLLVVPLDGNPVNNAAELRDILYVMKRSRTVSYNDNGGEPSTWLMSSIDDAIGTCVHGISTVLDSGSKSVDFLTVATFQGISLFNGKYITPELSWKIEDFWRTLDRNSFGHIQIVNAPVQKEFYIVLTTGAILIGNYSQGMDSKKIRWSLWTYNVNVATVGIWQINEILIGAD